MKFKFHVLFFFLFTISSVQQLCAGEMETLKRNFVSGILSEGDEDLINILKTIPRETISSDQIVVELMQRYPRTEAEIRELLSHSNADGSWSDIDYADKSLSGWKPFVHTQRTFMLAKVYNQKGSSYYHSKALIDRIHQSLQYWFKSKLVCRNWWYNQIGVPKALGAVFLLVEDQLSASEKEEAVTVMLNSKIVGTGQNMVWQSGNVLMRGLLQNNMQLVKLGRDSIAAQIVRNGSVEGIQIDHSFHQHGAQQQFGNYGAAFISDMGFWGKIFSGTSLAIDQPKLDILADLITQGYQRVIWKGFLDVNGLGRQFFRHAQEFKALSAAFAANRLRYADAKNKDKYSNFLNKGFLTVKGSPDLQGVYHFWNSDQTVARRPKWMASLKMASSRIIGAESLNGDNLKGFYIGDGAIYTYIDGSEYKDVFPLWDWRKVPGVTAYETQLPLNGATEGTRNHASFVGNVNDGNIGLTTMQLKRDKLSALKSYLFTDDFVLCLGAGIATDSASIVTTAIDQRLKRGELKHLKNKTWVGVKSLDIDAVQDTRFFSDQTGYIVLNAPKVAARDELKSGLWSDIMRSYPIDVKGQDSVVSLWIDHGLQPKNSAYQYFILPAATEQKTAAFDVKSVEILSNTKDLQVIFLTKERAVLISTLKAGEVKLPFNGTLKTKQPGLFLIKYKTQNGKPAVIYNDPTQELKFADYELNGVSSRVNLK